MQNIILRNNTEDKKLSVKSKQLISILGGAAAEFAAASLLHRIWEWSGKAVPAAVFGAVNESVWEHLKILLWPYLFWSFAVHALLKTDPKRLVTARAVGACAVISVTVGVFFIYSGILGYALAAVDIPLALIALLCGELVSIRLINSPSVTGGNHLLASAFILLLLVMLLCFTVNPPSLGLFRDTVSNI